MKNNTRKKDLIYIIFQNFRKRHTHKNPIETGQSGKATAKNVALLPSCMAMLHMDGIFFVSAKSQKSGTANIIAGMRITFGDM